MIRIGGFLWVFDSGLQSISSTPEVLGPEMTVASCRAWKAWYHPCMTSIVLIVNLFFWSIDETWFSSSYCFICSSLYFVVVCFKAVGVEWSEKLRSSILPGNKTDSLCSFRQKRESIRSSEDLGKLLSCHVSDWRWQVGLEKVCSGRATGSD